MSETDTKKLEADVEEAVNSEENISEKVRNITLKALTQRQLDSTAIKEVVEAVTQGVIATAKDNDVEAQDRIKKGLGGLDEALAKGAEAAKLAAEEVYSQGSDFVRNDLQNAVEELRSLEDLLLETLGRAASTGASVGAKALNGLLDHAQNSGTSLVQQTRAAGEQFAGELDKLARDSMDSAKAVGQSAQQQIAQVASGILSGMAEALSPSKKQ